MMRTSSKCSNTALHPLNLNTAGEDDLKGLKILSPLHIQNLISYRLLLGKFIDVYELQAVPGWDVSLLQKIKPIYYG